MDRKIFYAESSSALRHIDEVLGDLEHELLDVNLAGDVLTLAFEDGGKFVINAHSAAEQIWMAAGTTAWHFDYVPSEKSWRTSQGDELRSTLARVIRERIGVDVSL